MDFLTKRLRRYALAAACLFAGSFARAAELQPTTIRDFTCGLFTSADSTVIGDGCAQEIQNIDVWTGRLQKRRGSTLQNSTSLTGNQPVRFLHEFVDSNSNFWLIALSSNTLFKSNNAGRNFSVITSTHGLTSSTVLRAVNAYGKARFTDGTNDWIVFDGSVVTTSTPAPHGTTAAFMFERVFTSVGSLLYASAFGDPEDWTDGGLADDDAFSLFVRQNDGYSIRVLVPFKSGLLIFKDFSIDFLTMASDGLTPYLVSISNTKGTAYPDTVQVFPNEVIFLADDGFYSYDGVSLTDISEGISTTLDAAKQLNVDNRSVTTTTQSDFEAGSSDIGLSATEVVGSLVLSSAAATVDTFSDGDYTSNPVWTLVNNGTNLTAVVRSNQLRLKDTTNDVGTGDIFVHTKSTSSPYFSLAAQHQNTTANSSAGSKATMKVCNVVPSVATQEAGCYTTLLTYDTVSGTTATIKLYDGTSLITTYWVDGTSLDIDDRTTHTVTMERYADTTVSVSVNNTVIISSTVSNLSALSYISLGHQSVSIGGGITEGTGWDDVTMRASRAIFVSTPAATTNMTSWGPVSLDTDEDGGDITYAVYADSDTSLQFLSASTFLSSQTVTNLSVPTIATGAYIRWSGDYTRTALSQIPETREVVLAYNSGSGLNIAPASTNFEGDYLCALTTTSVTANDVIFVFDRGRAWTMYTGLNAGAMTRYRGNPYYGSNAGGSVYQFQVDDAFADNGSAIYANFLSKDFDFGFPIEEKTMRRYYITARYAVGSDAVFAYGVNRASTLTSTTLDLDSVSGFFRKAIIPTSLTYSKGVTHRFRLSDGDANQPFDILSVTLVPRLETAP